MSAAVSSSLALSPCCWRRVVLTVLCSLLWAAAGTLGRLDGIIRELAPDEARRLFRTFLLELAEVSSSVNSMRDGKKQAESECEEV